MYTFPVEVPVMPDTLSGDLEQKFWISEQIQQLVSALNLEHDRYEAAVSHGRSRRDNHEEDIRKIGESLISEAQARGWCDDFDKWVADINQRLLVELPTRVRQFTVTADYTVRIRTNVLASSEDDAIEMFREHHSLEQGRWDSSDFEDYDEVDIEAEEDE